MKKREIEWVRILWCDNANVIRGKAFHTAFLEEHQEQGIGISIAQQAVPVMYDAVVPGSGLAPVGEVWLRPDWSTLQALPYSPGSARVLGDLVQRGKPWAFCPRGFLRRMVAQAEEMGLHIMAAFENEFYLLQPGVELEPVDQTLFASTFGMDLQAPVIREMAQALIQQGIPVERYYPEGGPGQQEIAIRYSDALQAADRQIVFRETIRGVALNHNMRASFLPKIFEMQSGNGCHLHFSLWQQGQNLMPSLTAPWELSKMGRSFVAGLLHHLPALMALTTPSVNSYRRLQPHAWSGAFRCWGMDNREAAVRIPSNPTLPSPTHIELKTADASANPYLALGGAIAAGLDGIRQNMTLGEPVAVDPGHWSEAERQELGIDRLPRDLGEAIAHLSQNSLLLEALGSELAQAYLAVRKAEWEFFKDWNLADEAKLLLERY